VEAEANDYLVGRDPEGWDLDGLLSELGQLFPLANGSGQRERFSAMGRGELVDALVEAAEDAYEQQEREIGADTMRHLERLVMLRAIDLYWVQHLTAMENLRQGIGLHAVGQRDPLVMYRTEGHKMFEALLERIEDDVVRTIYHVQLSVPAGVRAGAARGPEKSPMAKAGVRRRQTPAVDTRFRKVGRNDPCPAAAVRSSRSATELIYEEKKTSSADEESPVAERPGGAQGEPGREDGAPRWTYALPHKSP